MVGAFEVVQAGGAPFDPALGVGRRIALSAFGHGVYLRPLGDTIYLLPPLSITPEEIGDLGVRLQAAIEESLALQ
jgi:adenosylmethionine-8-amino-7-oxononanoate aminotransferase